MEPNDKVFKLKGPCITMKIKQFARKAGLATLHAHTLRHKYAANLLERGADIRILQQLLGHENLSTTQIYLSVTDKRLREAANLLDDTQPQTKTKGKGMPWDPSSHKFSWEEHSSVADEKRRLQQEAARLGLTLQ